MADLTSAMGAEASAVAAFVVAAFAEGNAEEREVAYAALESAVRAAPSPSVAGGGGQKKNREAVALAKACAGPIITDVLCAPASKVGRAEYVRAAVLLCEMTKLGMVMVLAEAFRKDDAGAIPLISMWSTPDTALAEMLAQEPSEWTRGDAIVAAANIAVMTPVCGPGFDAVFAEAGVGTQEVFFGHWYTPTGSPYQGENPQPVDRYLPLALLCLDLVRSETDTQPEGIIAGASTLMGMLLQGKSTLGKAVWEAGFLEVFEVSMQRYGPMERISKSNMIAGGILNALNPVVEGAQLQGVEVIQPMLDAGALDISISTLNACAPSSTATPTHSKSSLFDSTSAAATRCSATRRKRM